MPDRHHLLTWTHHNGRVSQSDRDLDQMLTNYERGAHFTQRKAARRLQEEKDKRPSRIGWFLLGYLVANVLDLMVS